MQALRCEVAADGLLWSEGTGHSSNFFVLKCKDAPPNIASQQKHVHPLLIVPTEKGSITVFIVMILMLFVVMSSKSGAHVHCSHKIFEIQQEKLAV
jgi:hypothetical protein